MRSGVYLCIGIALWAGCVSAWRAAPVVARGRGATRAAPAMLASEPLSLASQMSAAPTDAPLPLPSVLLGDGLIDLVAGFAESPLILLLPIGVGSLVAFGIIFILVKSADSTPPKES